MSGSKQKTRLGFNTPTSPTHNSSSAITRRTVSFPQTLHATHTTVWLLYHSRVGPVQQVVPSTTTLLDTAQSEKKTISPFEKTRRARIVKAILSEPELLVLDEPLTGLDVNTRPILLNILRSLHESRSPRMIIGLRVQDLVPDWISHIALVTGETILTDVKDEIMFKHAEHQAQGKLSIERQVPLTHICNLALIMESP
ncbi:uncharacterized protein HD556DRAFT_1530902 [Suillus plorans]|uniref:ABC transporter domain-containing protein n=1 Tax=Suillus plorans TaxID=116603 RepID=A0A9P7DCD2_9AGAM|nr:uncharacterized protein HD556DRAFT_1530902 [Suillus plorans]KAG1786684.1 hypothetical protein HD556DRAFT_1530902 [Suillus plorans]